MFIARVSKGRTIREFIIGVLFVPVGFTFLWMTVFGNSAIDIVMHNMNGSLADAAQHNIPVALFEFLAHFPLSTLTSILAVMLIVTFFVTSADSGALVMDMLATGGAKKSLTQSSYSMVSYKWSNSSYTSAIWWVRCSASCGYHKCVSTVVYIATYVYIINKKFTN